MPEAARGWPSERTLGEALAAGATRLRTSGSETPRLDAEVLLADILATDRTAVLAHPEARLGPAQVAAFEAALERRERGEPVAYIRGLKEFYGFALSVDPRALIPRPETELLVDLGISRAVAILTGSDWRPSRGRLRVADVGTGCGAVAIALVATLRRRGYGSALDVLASDVSADAIVLARENTAAHGLAEALRFRQLDLLPDDESPYHVVLANLPYIPSREIADLPIAASFEPRAALDGGPDGLEQIGRLVERLPDRLGEPGIALIEIGPELRAGFERLVAAALPGWDVAFHDDLAHRTRVAELARARDRARGGRE